MRKKGQIGTIAGVIAVAVGIIVVAVAVSTSQNVTGSDALALSTQQQTLFGNAYTLLIVAVIAAIGALAVGAFYMLQR